LDDGYFLQDRKKSAMLLLGTIALGIVTSKVCTSSTLKNIGYAVTIYKNPLSAGYLAIDAMNTGTTTSKWCCRGAKLAYAGGIMYLSSVPAGLFLVTAPLL